MKYTLKKTIHTSTVEETTIDILDKEKFVYNWNGRHVIGIYPEPYDYTKTNAGNEIKGLIYHCYWGEVNTCRYFNIPDWQLKEIATRKNIKGAIEAKTITLFEIITENSGYEEELSKEKFIEMYNSFKDILDLKSHIKTNQR